MLRALVYLQNRSLSQVRLSPVGLVISIGLGIASAVVLTVNPDSLIFRTAAVSCWICIPLVLWFYQDPRS